MASLSRILVPVEFSPRCRGAVQYAEALACHFHAEIILLHAVLPPLANYSSFEAMAYSSADEFAEEVAAQRVLDLDAVTCKAPGGVRTMVVIGDPARTICETAAAEKCDLIVMPTHGYGPFRRFLLGSVTAKVLHDAVCPVFTSPHMDAAPDYTTIGFHKVLCALDLALHSREVLAWADWFAREYGASLTIVHAIHAAATRRGGFFFDPGFGIELTRHASERIDLLREDLSVNASVSIQAGETPLVVATTAEEQNASVLIIGRGSTPRAHGHLPTNAYAIVRESPCPVITI
ncbi:MAG: UspA domain protein [Candidatus Solibacter sp.]|nr:UspA domain protein [Candidatus Solibacter sp.]